MVGISKRIIILSTLLFVAIVGVYAWTLTPPPIVSLNDIQIELETDKTEYNVNEVIDVKVYFYNDKPYSVRINMNIDKALIGYSLEHEVMPISLGHGYAVVYSEIQPNSRIMFHSGTLKPKYAGEFCIYCLGVNKTVPVSEPIG